MYVFIQVSPCYQTFEKVLGYSSDQVFVDYIIELIDSNRVFNTSFRRTEAKIRYMLSETDQAFMHHINTMLNSDLEWIDELIIQPVDLLESFKGVNK